VAWVPAALQDAAAQALAQQQGAATAAAAAAAAALSQQQHLNNVVPAAGIHGVMPTGSGAAQGSAGQAAGSGYTPCNMDLDPSGAAAGGARTAEAAAAALAGHQASAQTASAAAGAAAGLMPHLDVSAGSGKGGYVSDQVPALAIGQQQGQTVKAKAAAVMGSTSGAAAPAAGAGAASAEGLVAPAPAAAAQAPAYGAWKQDPHYQQWNGVGAPPQGMHMYRKSSGGADVYESSDIGGCASDVWAQGPANAAAAAPVYHHRHLAGTAHTAGVKGPAGAAGAGPAAAAVAAGLYHDASVLAAQGPMAHHMAGVQQPAGNHHTLPRLQG
jgi:hypothetical protein